MTGNGENAEEDAASPVSSRQGLPARVAGMVREALRDVVLIVASILIAFALDSWWSGRQDEAREARHRAALEHEFAGLVSDLGEDHEEVVRAMAATRAILSAMGSASLAADPDSLASLLNASFDAGLDVPPQGGALSAILSSGDLRLIRDDSLTYLLAEWPRAVEELRAENELLTANRERELRSRMVVLGVPESAIATHLGAWLDLPPTRFPFDPSALLRDPGIESMLVSRLIRLRILDELFVETIDRAGRILARLRAS